MAVSANGPDVPSTPTSPAPASGNGFLPERAPDPASIDDGAAGDGDGEPADEDGDDDERRREAREAAKAKPPVGGGVNDELDAESEEGEGDEDDGTESGDEPGDEEAPLDAKVARRLKSMARKDPKVAALLGRALAGDDEDDDDGADGADDVEPTPEVKLPTDAEVRAKFKAKLAEKDNPDREAEAVAILADAAAAKVEAKLLAQRAKESRAAQAMRRQQEKQDKAFAKFAEANPDWEKHRKDMRAVYAELREEMGEAAGAVPPGRVLEIVRARKGLSKPGVPAATTAEAVRRVGEEKKKAGAAAGASATTTRPAGPGVTKNPSPEAAAVARTFKSAQRDNVRLW